MKKRLISILLIVTFLIYSQSWSFCLDYTDLEDCMKEDNWDFLGWKWEGIYSKLKDDYAQGNPLRKLEFDIKNAKISAYLILKTFDENDLIYLWFGGSVVLIKLKKGAYLLKLIR